MHGESPAVQRLPIHFPNEHYVNFHAHQTVNEVLARQNVENVRATGVKLQEIPQLIIIYGI